MVQHIHAEHQEARRLFEEAVALDPRYASAWTSLGMAHWVEARWGWGTTRESSLNRAVEAAHTALEIDSASSSAFSLLGAVHLTRGEHDQAIAMMDKSVELAPNHAENVALSAMALVLSNRPDEAIRRMQRAMRLSPIHPTWYSVMLANSYLFKGDIELALSTFRAAVRREPEMTIGRVWLINALMVAGLTGQAGSEASAVLSIEPSFSVNQWTQGIRFKDDEWNSKLARNLKTAGLPN